MIPSSFRPILSFLPLVAIVIVNTGCAIGNKHNYRDVLATLPSTSGENVTIATHDRRPYVVNNDKSPSFVGLQRGGYGNPFDVENENAEALSKSFSAAACASIVASGGQCDLLDTIPSEETNSIKARLEKSGAPRAVLFTLNEWKSDTMMNTALHYDVAMEVLSPSGTVLLTRRLSGVDDLRGSFWNAPGYAKKVVPMAFKGKLEQLLGDPEVQASLKSKAIKVSGSAKAGYNNDSSPNESAQSSCSVSQILEMKKLGLSDSQIQKSCH